MGIKKSHSKTLGAVVSVGVIGVLVASGINRAKAKKIAQKAARQFQTAVLIGAGLAFLLFFYQNCGSGSRSSLGLDASLPAVGFLDTDLTRGVWRTDFDSATMGTASRPLSLGPCAFTTSDPYLLLGAGPSYFDENSQQMVYCDTFSKIYPSSNASTNSSKWPTDNFWVVTANNERAYGLEGACSDSGPNTGPPNQSKPVGNLGTGVFGISTANNKVTLKIDTASFPNCVTPIDKGKTTFLSFGAQTGRGNSNAPLAYLNNGSPNVLKFDYSIPEIAPSGTTSSLGKSRANFGYVFIEAQWGGKRRWLYIDLFSRSPFGARTWERHDWNWNIGESMWYPGAEIIFTNPYLLSQRCNGALLTGTELPPTPGSSTTIAFDLDVAFNCLGSSGGITWSTPIPTIPVPVTGVHWALEQTFGTNWTSMSVSNISLGSY